MSTIEARSKRVRLWKAPIGLFYCGDTLCLKTEYGNNEGRIDAYIVESGEFFWGGAKSDVEQREILVTPAIVSTASQAAPPTNPLMEKMASTVEDLLDKFMPGVKDRLYSQRVALEKAQAVLDAYNASKEESK